MSTLMADEGQSHSLLPPESVSSVSAANLIDDHGSLDDVAATFQDYCDQEFRITDAIEPASSLMSLRKSQYNAADTDIQVVYEDRSAEFNEASDDGIVHGPSISGTLRTDDSRNSGHISEISDNDYNENSNNLLAAAAPTSNVLPSQEPHRIAEQSETASMHNFGFNPNPESNSNVGHDNRATANPAHSGPSTPEENQFQIQKYWKPLCLRREVLLSLSAIFLMCLLGTALLYTLSKQNHGLSAEDESRHYAWKYGPTAVLTVILYFWDSIDLTVKSLLPWQELQRGPKSADVTIMLDYISPILTTSLFRSLKNRHWAVFLTITGRLLILLTIAFSTALLALTPTEVAIENVSFTAPKFDTESFNFDDVGPLAADVYYGVNFGNLAAPLGTFTNTCVPSLTVQDTRIPPNAKLQATVPGLIFDAGCEIVETDEWQNVSALGLGLRRPRDSPGALQDTILTFNITTPSCRIIGVLAGEQEQQSAVDSLQARVGYYVCNLPWNYYDIEATKNGYKTLVNMSSSAWSNASSDHRILLTVVNWFEDNWNDEGTLKQSSALLCKPSYAVNNNQVTYNRNSQTAQLESSEPNKDFIADLPGFPQSLLGSSVLSSISQASTLDTAKVNFNDSVDPMFSLMQLQANSIPINRFLDPEVLKASFTEVFKGVAVQLAHQTLSNSSENGDIKGTATFLQNRLHVTQLSTGIMCAAFGALACISAGLVLLVPRDVVISEPGSIYAIASSLELTPELVRVMRGLGHVRDKTIGRSLSPYLFDAVELGTSRKPEKIRVKTSARQHSAPTISATKMKNELQWWRPLGGERWFLFISLALPIIAIGVLELLQKRSNQNDGFVEIHSQWGQIATNYVPAILSILIGAMFSSIAAASSVFAPYSSLVKTPTQSSHSIALNYMTKTGPRLGYTSFKNKHFGLSVIAASQLIASVLTIVLSGLYSIADVKFQGDITLQQLDRFNITDALSNSNPNAGLLTKLITYYDMKFPSWTYESIVLPRIAVVNASVLDDTQNVTINSMLKGIRGSLNCTAIPSQNSILSIQNVTRTETQILYPPAYNNPGDDDYIPQNGMNLIVTIKRTLPKRLLCDKIESDATENVTWTENLFIRNDSTPSPFGRVSVLDWDLSGGGTLTALTRRQSLLTRQDMDVPIGCPSLGISLGKVAAKWPRDNTTIEPFVWSTWTPTDVDIGTLVCWPKFEEFDVNTTFNWPSFDIPEHLPPRIQQSSLREVENPTSGSSAWEWNDVHDLWSDLKNTNDLQTSHGFLQNDTNFDPFILALRDGKNGVPLEQISGENNTEALKQYAQALWGLYMAQSISQNMREDADSGFPAASPDDTTSVSGPPQSSKATSESASMTYRAQVEAMHSNWPRRVIQNESSKLALQTLLGLMSFSVALTYFLIRFQKVLPHNPCSIAGTLSLVIDGNVRNMPLNITERHMRGRKHKKYTRLHGTKEIDEDDQDTKQKFVMGWWNDGGIRKFGVTYAQNPEE